MRAQKGKENQKWMPARQFKIDCIKYSKILKPILGLLPIYQWPKRRKPKTYVSHRCLIQSSFVSFSGNSYNLFQSNYWIMYEPASVVFVRTKRRKMDTDSSRGADGENNCVSAKRRKSSMGKSRGTTDDSGWNVCSHLTSTTPKPNSILTTTNTSSLYCDVEADDQHFQNGNTEKTLFDLYLRPTAGSGKTQKTKQKNIYSDKANNLSCHCCWMPN